MLTEYIEAALESAEYEIIEDDEPYYGCHSPVKRCLGHGKDLRRMPTQLKGSSRGLDCHKAATRTCNPPIGQYCITELKGFAANG